MTFMWILCSFTLFFFIIQQNNCVQELLRFKWDKITPYHTIKVSYCSSTVTCALSSAFIWCLVWGTDWNLSNSLKILPSSTALKFYILLMLSMRWRRCRANFRKQKHLSNLTSLMMDLFVQAPLQMWADTLDSMNMCLKQLSLASPCRRHSLTSALSQQVEALDCSSGNNLTIWI